MVVPTPVPVGMPHGVTFVRMLRPPQDESGTRAPGPTEVYRNGRRAFRAPSRVLVARDRWQASLQYDRQTRSVRPIGGGLARHFDPCPDPFNELDVFALSPNGKRGFCADEYAHSGQLIVFDVARVASRRLLFRISPVNRPYVAAWVDDERIAVMELQTGACPYYRQYGAAPTNLAIIDLHGHVLERGPCMAGVLAGARGLVYIDYRGRLASLEDWFNFLTFHYRQVATFSVDRGRTWHWGRPQFADDDGRACYLPNDYHDATLACLDGRPSMKDVFGADWARDAAQGRT